MDYLFILGIIILVVAIILARRWRKKMEVYSEIAPAHVLQKHFNLFAENRPTIILDSNKVPDDLRHLIPLAEKWGIGDDIIRCDFEGKATYEEKMNYIMLSFINKIGSENG